MYDGFLDKYSNGVMIEVEDFIEDCKLYRFTDDDGYGRAVKNERVNITLEIKPSKINEIPDDAIYILWFNK